MSPDMMPRTSERPAHPYLVSIREGASLTRGADGRVTATTASRSVDLGLLSSDTLATVLRLGAECMSLEAMIEDLVARDPTMIPSLMTAFTALSDAGLIAHSLCIDGRIVATLVPHGRQFDTTLEPVDPDRVLTRAEGLWLAPSDGGLCIEAPLAPARVESLDWRMTALVQYLAAKRTAAAAARELPGVDQKSACDCAGLLCLAGLFSPERPVGQPTGLRLWELADLRFHVHSRRGYRDVVFGAADPSKRRGRPLPAVRPPAAAEFIGLAAPDIAELTKGDRPFTDVLEARRSDRRFAAEPITINQLAEFLFRVARIRGEQPAGDGSYAAVSRPYPSAGACHELEFYLAVDKCTGLDRGFYRYAPDRHGLERLDGAGSAVDRLLDDAQRSSGATSRPHVLIVLAARLGRVAWKYRQIGYALVLKNVGVAMQTMYLVATSMGLAACALGGGDAALFSQATGLDDYAEVSVGEFMIGSRAANQIGGNHA